MSSEEWTPQQKMIIKHLRPILELLECKGQPGGHLLIIRGKQNMGVKVLQGQEVRAGVPALDLIRPPSDDRLQPVTTFTTPLFSPWHVDTSCLLQEVFRGSKAVTDVKVFRALGKAAEVQCNAFYSSKVWWLMLCTTEKNILPRMKSLCSCSSNKQYTLWISFFDIPRKRNLRGSPRKVRSTILHFTQQQMKTFRELLLSYWD